MLFALQFRNRGLYTGIGLGSAFLLFAALGPGLFQQYYNPFSWQYLAFRWLCHQDLSRSFFLGDGNVPMAVCARCIGIYAGFLGGWGFQPIMAWLNNFSKKWEKKLFTSIIILNLCDVLGNNFGFWTNTSHSRLLLGVLLGLSAAIFLTQTFFNQHKSES